MLENAEANRHAPPTSIGSVSDGVRAGGLLFVGEPHSPDTAGDLAFETAMASLWVLPWPISRS